MNSFEQNHEESQFDDNLLRSIETLLDEETTTSPDDSKMMNDIHEEIPDYRHINNGAFSFGEQVYQKWSNNESSNENAAKIQRHFVQKSVMNHVKAPHIIKSMKKNAAINATVPTVQPDPRILQYQAMLAEKANQILNQYFQLNFEFLSAQAAILGLPLEQYIQNLLIATTNPTVLLPFQMPQSFPNMMAPNNVPNYQSSPQPQRKFTNRLPFSKKN